MITDEQARSIALFFLFTLMDEKAALHVAHKTVSEIKSTGEGRKGALTSASLLTIIRKNYESHVKHVGRRRVASASSKQNVVTPEKSWVLPDHFDISQWVKFHKEAAQSEVIAVTLSKILRFNENEIAHAWSLSLGTVRYRIAKGIRQLGILIEKSGKVRA